MKTCGECGYWFGFKRKDGTIGVRGYCRKWPSPAKYRRGDAEAWGCFQLKAVGEQGE